MKKKALIIVFCLSYGSILLSAANKPVIKIGWNGSGYFKQNALSDKLYPEELKDHLYWLIDETFSPYLRIKFKINFYFSQYNKYSEDFKDLYQYTLNHVMSYYFTFNKVNQFTLSFKPTINYKYGDYSLVFDHRFQYKLQLEHLLMQFIYIQNFTKNEDITIRQQFAFNLCWNSSRTEFIKFKTGFSLNFQHDLIKLTETTIPLKSVKLNFELAIDFNKLNNFENLFDLNKEEDLIYE